MSLGQAIAKTWRAGAWAEVRTIGRLRYDGFKPLVVATKLPPANDTGGSKVKVW